MSAFSGMDLFKVKSNELYKLACPNLEPNDIVLDRLAFA